MSPPSRLHGGGGGGGGGGGRGEEDAVKRYRKKY